MHLASSTTDVTPLRDSLCDCTGMQKRHYHLTTPQYSYLSGRFQTNTRPKTGTASKKDARKKDLLVMAARRKKHVCPTLVRYMACKTSQSPAETFYEPNICKITYTASPRMYDEGTDACGCYAVGGVKCDLLARQRCEAVDPMVSLREPHHTSRCCSKVSS